MLYLLGMALNFILSMAVTMPLLFIVALMPGINTPQRSQTVGFVVLLIVYGAAFAVQAFTRPVYGISLLLFYYDQRIRQEAFDIEWMMMRAGLIAPAMTPTQTEAQTTAGSAPVPVPVPALEPVPAPDADSPALPEPSQEEAAHNPANPVSGEPA